ncbi:MAG: hypothetical protein ACPGU5_07515 [Lishizhenia sp.]
MKDFEKILKDKLDNFEMPYESDAWNAMQSKLEKVKPVSSKIKWLYLVASITAIALGVTFLTNSAKNDEVQDTSLAAKKLETKTERTTNNLQLPKEEKTSESNLSSENNIVSTSDKTQKPTAVSNFESSTQTNNAKNDHAQKKPASNNQVLSNTKVTVLPDPDHSLNTQKLVFIVGKIDKNRLCKGEAFKIYNSGSEHNRVKFCIERDTVILTHSKEVRFTPKNTIHIDYLNENNEIIGTEEIIVNDLPNAAFTLEANLIEKGIPVAYISASDQMERTWEVNAAPATFVDENHLAIFESGDVKISSTVTDLNGCKATVEQTVAINDVYNLLAPTGFIPQSLRTENMFFMPFALEERNTSFTLIILNPKDGQVVFETNDASVKWDGIDKRTGNLVDFNAPYIWQVKLDNPLPNEKNIYKGTVQMLRKP